MPTIEITSNPINVTVDTTPIIVNIETVNSNISVPAEPSLEVISNPINVTLNNYQVDLEVTQETPQITVNNSRGIDGKSAYQIAVDNGFVGTVEEWLTSLVGIPGNLAAKVEYIFPAGLTHQIALSSIDLVGFNSIQFYNQNKESISVYYSYNSNYIFVDSNVDLLNHIMVIY